MNDRSTDVWRGLVGAYGLTLKALLQRTGDRVSGLQRARAALRAIHAKPRCFDYLVRDYNMLRSGGMNLTHKLYPAARIR